MSRLAFRLQSIPAASGSVVRIDTASGSNTPADLRTLGGNAIDGAVIRSGSNGGHLPTILGPDGVTTLYQKTLDYRGQVTGSPVTLTGEDDNPSAPSYSAASGPYVRPDVIVPAATGTAATDRAVLLQAINDTPENGQLYLSGGIYAIDQPLVIAKSINIRTNGMTETWKAVQSGGALNHPSDNGVAGTVIKQVTAATDVLQITGSAKSVNLRDLALTFDSAIRGTNTGHGIYAHPSAAGAGGGHESGLLGFRWDNLTVFGHDGNHYAYDLLNFMYGTISHLHSYGGGGFNLACDSFQGNYGNLVVEHPYVELTNAGSADAYRLSARTRRTSTGTLNLMTFVRPQANITSAAATQGTQATWNANGGTALPDGIVIIAPDFEVNPSGSSNPCDLGGVNSGTKVIGAGIMTRQPTGGYTSERGHQVFTSSGTFVVPDGVWEIECFLIPGGGGGGGGGTNAAAAANVGGGGGGAGMPVRTTLPVVPRQSFAITVGAGGTAGTGGAAGGNPGTAGGQGGQTTFGGDIKAQGGGGGAGGLASSTTAVNGGYAGRTGSTSAANVPGFGGNAQSPNGLGAVQLPPATVGGGGGGASSTTLGGGGGGAATSQASGYGNQGGGNQGTSGTVNGVAGTTATLPGCGGGGGGGALAGGAGGNGGAGAPGQADIWW